MTRLLVLPTRDWTPPGVGIDVLAGRNGPLLQFHHFLEDFYPLCLLEPIGEKIFLNNFFSSTLSPYFILPYEFRDILAFLHGKINCLSNYIEVH